MKNAGEIRPRAEENAAIHRSVAAARRSNNTQKRLKERRRIATTRSKLPCQPISYKSDFPHKKGMCPSDFSFQPRTEFRPELVEIRLGKPSRTQSLPKFQNLLQTSLIPFTSIAASNHLPDSVVPLSINQPVRSIGGLSIRAMSVRLRGAYKGKTVDGERGLSRGWLREALTPLCVSVRDSLSEGQAVPVVCQMLIATAVDTLGLIFYHFWTCSHFMQRYSRLQLWMALRICLFQISWKYSRTKWYQWSRRNFFFETPRCRDETPRYLL